MDRGSSSAHRRSPPLPRRRGWLLVALAAGLALDPSAPAPDLPDVAAAPLGAEIASAPGAAERMAGVLRRANPTLSTSEILRISEAIVRYGAKYALPPDLVGAILLVESGARPWAVSPKGARGLMQVMPYMVRPLGMAGNLSTIETNIEAGCIILADNIRRLGEADGVSAYFWGSEIRDGGYLARVRAARAKLQELASS
jgi:soluble lytic murein transglycosylase-like protein